jgi:DNA repair protein RecN (Recombination protein N)
VLDWRRPEEYPISKNRLLHQQNALTLASIAENHLNISKEVKGQRTMTKVQTLNKKQRSEEIARMLGGKEITELTLQHATELLELSAKQK